MNKFVLICEICNVGFPFEIDPDTGVLAMSFKRILDIIDMHRYESHRGMFNIESKSRS